MLVSFIFPRYLLFFLRSRLYICFQEQMDITSDDEFEIIAKKENDERIVLIRKTVHLMQIYYDTYIHKVPCMD